MPTRMIKMKYKVEALYVAPTWFEIDFDLRNVTSWYIKYDVLNVIHNKGEDWKSYQLQVQVTVIIVHLRGSI